MPTIASKLTDRINTADPIIKYGDPILRQVASPVKELMPEMADLTERMAEIMHGAKGVGLAAPQLGISQRVIIYDVGEGLVAMVNPQIVKMSGEQLDPPEGCLSIPGLRGVVKRAAEVTVKALDEHGQQMRIKADGYAARVIQHEVDHLNGVLFIDLADPDTLKWMTPEEIEEEREEDEGGEE